MRKEIAENQALQSNMLYFDPIFRPFEKEPSGPSSPIDPSAGLQVKLPSAPIGNGIGPQLPKRAVEYLEDGSIEICYFAPDAKKVEVAGNGGTMTGRYNMELQDDGYWKVVLTGITPGLHYVVFIVDGVLTMNPTMSIGTCGYAMNYIDVPDPNQDFYLLKDVPHGTLHMEHLKSDICGGRYRSLWIYTPAGYDENPDKRYPVLHVLHGGGEDETAWFFQAKLNYIADNTIAEGKCEEMIIVCSTFHSPRDAGDRKVENMNFTDIMVNEIVPFVDSKYRTIPDRHMRALCGLSAGGGQTRQITNSHPEVFANIGQFSSGAGFTEEGISTVPGGLAFSVDGSPVVRFENKFGELFKTPEHYNATMDVTFVTCGTEDPRHKYTEPQVQEFVDKGYNVEYKAYAGAHEFIVWRYSARDFMMRLFKKNK